MRQLLLMLSLVLVFGNINVALADSLNVRGSILMDIDSREIIYHQNANRKIPPASLTKVMSMYLVFDAIEAKTLSLNTLVKVSKKADITAGASMGIITDEIVTVKQLLYGMAVASGNDACVAIAEHMAGSEYAFTVLMNKKARALKMNNTVFKTSSGLPAKGQYTTAQDMLTLSRNYIMTHPGSLSYHSTKRIIFHGKTLRNKNPQLGTYNGTDGLKTGWTRASGYNIISTSRRGDTRLIAVILGAKTSKIRAKELNRLMNAGFSYSKGETQKTQNILRLNSKQEVTAQNKSRVTNGS